MLGTFLLAAALQLPPITWTCPMDPQVAENKAGKCPVCGMPLAPVRLDTVWSCPVHAAIVRSETGRCPICRRDLVPVTMAVSWICKDRPDSERLQPGRCADGSIAAIRYTPRPHGNHNPQHGGVFFMAPDNWHHLEGVYPSAGVFRVYFYDDYSKPLPPDQLPRIAGRVETSGSSAPLRVAPSGRYLESTIPVTRPPVEITAKLRFQPDAPEYRFDFAFASYSTGAPAADVSPVAAASAGGPASEAASDIDGNLSQLHARAAEIGAAIDRRAYGEIWVPALQAKDVALEIESRAPDNEARAAVSSAVKRVVRAAWALDADGDTGDAEQIARAYSDFSAAVAALDAALGRARR